MARTKTTAQIEPITEAPQRVRGFYETPLGKFRSVTTILEGGYAKPGLPYWSAGEVARAAIENIPYLAGLRGRQAREEAFDWLRRAADAKKDAAADLGSAVHRHAEARVLGEPMPDPTDEQQPFIDALDRFFDDWHPEFEAAELVCANPDNGHAGTGDGWVRFPRLGKSLALIDYKTGKRAYGEAGMQEAAYRYSPVGWLRDGTQVDTPTVDRAYVVHLRPDAYPDGYALIPVRADADMYQQFLAVKRVTEGRRLVDKALGDPLDNNPESAAEVA